MSQDKAFDQWHKRFRHLDRNDARIAWDAGIMDERRRAVIQPTAAKPVAYVTRRALERESEFTVMAHPEGDSVALYTAPVAPADAVRDARDLALEEAAQLCDEQANEPECPERAAYCADAIRALKTDPKEPAK